MPRNRSPSREPIGRRWWGHRSGAVAVVLLAASMGSAEAASPIPIGTEVPGTALEVHSIGSSYWCSMVRGSARYRRNSSTSVVIDLPEIAYMNIGTGDYQRYGALGRLTFTNASSGSIGFDKQVTWPVGLRNFPFNSYTESWDAPTKSLTVKMNIVMPGCTLAVIGFFLSP